MKIVVAPDSFKGSLPAQGVCRAVKEGIHAVFPEAEVVELPLADGGEGIMESMVYATGGNMAKTEVQDPLLRKIESAYGVLSDGETVIIEMAQASGLPLLAERERNPLAASSFGTGELIRAALDAGYRKFIIGIGGSATNDAGAGMLRALGTKFFDAAGNELEDGGAALARLARFDGSALDPRIGESAFLVASDVRNKLCGPSGASAVFGPQKGATPEMVGQLDAALGHFADVVMAQKGVDLRSYEGGGAAGGMGASLIAFLHATLQSGIDLVMETIGFDEKIRGADLVITGEGRLDAQTLDGKLITGITKAAGKAGVPVIALAGSQALTSAQAMEIGLVSAFSIVSGPCTVEEAMAQAEWLIKEKTIAVMNLLKLSTYGAAAYESR
ncbi:glycerate kinase [Planomicrobium sp. CPCC 101110]|uniref:glycerate kinase n=1 Tax=Planomicrobium sp. CPCC 101110 TaxID=2599619 RepID=UPI0011B85525|nr:glycerate kinase [Planomicrobium sp. CPCC 101110]TWT27276.1 glycerate kinase [Planomicrobium sp. CPCC 101110]